MKKGFVLFLVLVSVIRLSAQQKGETVSDVFVSTHKDSLPYQFISSPILDTSKTYPLILWLHGKGERGSENSKQMMLIKKWLVDSIQKENYHSFILAPQCNETRMWSNYDKLAKQITFDTITPEIQYSIMELIGDLKKDYPIDSTRIYIMGISMGGFGVFDMITRNPCYFAAAIPVCGGADPNQVEKLQKTPIWAFHGEKDQVVDKRHSVVPMDMIKDADHILTKYPEIGHNAWIKAFKEKGLLKWMFDQKLEMD